jgi:hypothetical protein
VQQVIRDLFLEPGFHLDPAVFAKAWAATEDASSLPDDFSWKRISKRFSRKVEAIREDSAELRETFARLRSAKDSEVLRELSGLPPEFDLDKYAEALVERFASLSLDSLDTDGAAYNAVPVFLCRFFFSVSVFSSAQALLGHRHREAPLHTGSRASAIRVPKPELGSQKKNNRNKKLLCG